jgi:hypothetical protein
VGRQHYRDPAGLLTPAGLRRSTGGRTVIAPARSEPAMSFVQKVRDKLAERRATKPERRRRQAKQGRTGSR